MRTLSETIELMTSENYDDRLKAEYYQLVIRMIGLNRMLEGYKSGTLGFTPKCSYELLNAQLQSMRNYAHYLEERAKVEEINLKTL